MVSLEQSGPSNAYRCHASKVHVFPFFGFPLRNGSCLGYTESVRWMMDQRRKKREEKALWKHSNPTGIEWVSVRSQRDPAMPREMPCFQKCVFSLFFFVDPNIGLVCGIVSMTPVGWNCSTYAAGMQEPKWNGNCQSQQQRSARMQTVQFRK